MAPELFPRSLPVFSHLAGLPAGHSWLAGLPDRVDRLRRRWGLVLGAPLRGGTSSWVAPARRPDGTEAVLKVTWPHPEASAEPDALRRWAGRAAVRLLDVAGDDNALLLERVRPATPLAAAEEIPPARRLELAAEVVAELWSVPVGGVAVPGLAAVCAGWAEVTAARAGTPGADLDAGLVRRGVELLRELPSSADRAVLLHGDLNPGNLLAARRRPWLAIDPKPVLGDPAYELWPLVEQVDDPRDRPSVLASRFRLLADVLGLDPARVAAWALARTVEGALWSAAHGDPAGGRSAMAVAPVLARLAGV
ncbi:aminoglycoside phosphotransferase family protein [Actinoalloteichus caeruleus]|uniref:aminoglycoside phosphotransferase family protein n=1 Tax=Actinoalloteichus cyanogriseus TaxID=2893586 RepID=UPI0004AA1072|nr:aminoglycoside phosphotransferase family protein [Actinoalloteichus caeruleus]